MHAQVLRVLTSAIYFDMHPKVKWIDEWILEAWTKDRYIHCKMQLAVCVRIFINTKRHLEDKWVKLKEDIIREYEGIFFPLS